MGHIVLVHLPEEWPSFDQVARDILPKDTPQLSCGGPFEGYVDLIPLSAQHLCPPRSWVSVQNHSAIVEEQVPERKMLTEIISISYSFSLE